ncbi:hypothetical protein EHV15_34920 [Paenibacillus oralis]|uniref:Uncharacterized protein n=1 Tax=Paenibacillus oralis TaxID=2490856 RepID=A0A3P3T9R7_9BACL|nr:hypothetical protein [Paenibacillus oralis]RRJ54786.1 hypothetical protein EHV15_34920 [Paenibacillus oralis]
MLFRMEMPVAAMFCSLANELWGTIGISSREAASPPGACGQMIQSGQLAIFRVEMLAASAGLSVANELKGTFGRSGSERSNRFARVHVWPTEEEPSKGKWVPLMGTHFLRVAKVFQEAKITVMKYQGAK